MAYGTIKVNNITFDDGGSDQTVTVSGLYNAFTNDIAVTGTISGTTVTGTTANFVSGVFTTQISGTTVTGTTSSFTTGNFTTLSGATATFTSGVFASGTAAAPSVSVGTASNGIFSPDADQVAVATNGGERLRITSAGLVGIGTSSPRAKIHVLGAGQATAAIADAGNLGSFIRVSEASTATGAGGGILFSSAQGDSADSVGFAAIKGLLLSGGGNTTGHLAISTRDATADTALTERVRITSAGNVGIGTTSPGYLLEVNGASGANSEIALTSAAFQRHIIRQGGTGDGGLQLINQTTGTERARIDSSGRLLVGTSTARGVGAATASALEVENSGLGISCLRNSSDFVGGIFCLGKSRGSVTGATTIVQAGDTMGSITFAGADGTDVETIGARIDAQVDGTPGANDMPGRLVFSTTAGGASSPTERMRITNAGDVGIGTANPATTLHVNGDVTITDKIIHSGDTNTAIRFPANDTVTVETSGSERVRIDSAGRILLSGTTQITPGNGNTETGITFNGDAIYASKDEFSISTNRNSDGRVIRISRSGTQVGTISVTATNTAYNTSSDYRLKENVAAVTDGITRLQQLKPSRFNFIADPDTVVDGFIAHEAAEVIPECVTGTKDEVDENGNPVYQGIDQSKIVPLLTAALQEAIAKIETLEQRLTAAGID